MDDPVRPAPADEAAPGAGPGTAPSSRASGAVSVVRDRAPFIWLLVGAAIVLWLGRAILAPFILAAVLAYAFSPLVGRASERTGWPRVVVVAIAYVFVVALLVLAAVLLAGRIANELTLLAASGPDSLATLLRDLVGQDSIEIGGQHIAVADVAREIQSRLGDLLASPGDAVHMAGEVGSVLLETLLALIVTFYFLVDGPSLWHTTTEALPFRQRDRTMALLDRIHLVLGRWLRGQLVLIALVAAVIYVALGPILHLPYALGIAILSGFLEIIPLIGPLIATAIAAIDAFAHGGAGLAAVVIVIYFVVRQVEDNLVMPQVIGRVVHLHPVVTIFAVLVGLQVYGILGGLLGVPVAAAVNVVYREFYGAPEPLPADPPPPAAGEPAAPG
jgi:predicted PurR-regulated permease PerM